MKLFPAPPGAQAIAIVGAACRLPQAPDLDSLARLLEHRVDAVTAIPPTRWATALFGSTDPRQPGKSYTWAAGVLDQIDQFDPEAFAISPREAMQMDPQQRLLLELAYEAIEDAGLRASALRGSRTGVFVGGSSSDYVTLRLGDPSSADAYFMTGSTLCSLSNRVSHSFDLRGPSFTVDTACSSSLVALHLGCEALRRGEVELALVGGVNLLLAPQSFVGFSRAAMLSPTGRCHAFAAAADGYVRAEGGGMLVLRALDEALAEGDAIHAVIRATAVNSDGHTNGISLPSEAAQAALLEEVYARAGVRADELVYIEAHGTGTQAGDPIEAAALGAVLGRRRGESLPIGSVKTNIGHLEAASGMAGLFKLLVALRTRVVPASLHGGTPNPAIPFAALNLRLLPEALSLPRTGTPVVGINSFGFGGTNAHAVLQAPPPCLPVPALPAPPMLLLSARTPAGLHDAAADWLTLLERMPQHSLGPAMRGATRRRDHHASRLVVVGSEPAALSAGLTAYLQGRATSAVVTDTALREPGTLAFAYAGNGSQWTGMAADAWTASPAFAQALRDVDRLLQPLLGWSVCAALPELDHATLMRTDIAQPLLFAIQVAVVTTLRGLGVVAAAHIGHSAGEVAAAWAAGALPLEAACTVIAVRSRLQQATNPDGRMAALGMGEAAARVLLAGVDVEIAAVNARDAVTIAGSHAAITVCEQRAHARACAFVRLDVQHAFHSAAMDQIQAPLLHALAALEPSGATATLASTVTGELLGGAALDGRYWWRNIRAPVRFAQAAAALVQHGVRVFVEIGPQAVMQSFLRDALQAQGASGRALPSLTRRPAKLDPLLLAAARCHAAGHDLSAGPLFEGPASHRGLPPTQWQRERYWFTRTGEATDLLGAQSAHPWLGYRHDGAGLHPAWFSHLELAAFPWLADHVVDGAVLLPAAAMIDIAGAAAAALHPHAPAHELADLEISRPLVLEWDTAQELRFGLTGADGRFEFASRPRLAAHDPGVHATGRLAAAEPGPAVPTAPHHTQTGRIEADAFYTRLRALGLHYGPGFRSVRAVRLLGPRMAVVELDSTHAACHRIDPAMLDGAFQALAALVSLERAGRLAAMVPVRFGRIRLAASAAAGATALVGITASGPRAVCADITIADADGAAVAWLTECWFMALPAAIAPPPPERAFRYVHVPTLVATLAATLDDRPVAGAALPPPPPVPDGCSPGLLGDALLAERSLAALRALADPHTLRLDPAARAAAGAISPAALPALWTMVTWLEQDGLATRDGPEVVLAQAHDLPEAPALFGSLLFDCPGHAAEATLLAHATEGFAAVLATGTGSRLPAALVDQMLFASASAQALLDRVEQDFAALVAHWPADRMLRVLELDAGYGVLTRRLLRHVTAHPDCRYCALTSRPDGVAALHLALREISGAEVRLFDAAAAWPGGEVDIAVGVYGLTHMPGAAAWLAAALRPGGIVRLAEPAPHRLWQCLQPHGLNAGGGVRGGAAWLAILGALGAGLRVEPIAGALWSGSLLSGRAPERPHADTIADTGHVLVCDAVPSWLPELPDALPAARFCASAELPGQLAAAPAGTRLIIVMPGCDGADPVGHIARVLAGLAALAAPLTELEGAALWLVCRGGAADPLAAALLGWRRVLANESGGRRCRLLRFDPALSASDVTAALGAELGAADDEDEPCWTPAGRFAARLRPGLAPPHPGPGQARLTVAQPGLLDTLAWQALPALTPGPGEVLVDIQAAGLNFRDVMWALGVLPDEALLHGFAGPTLGLECAGVVAAVGPGVDALTPGMRVMGLAPACLATRTLTRADALVPIPAGMSDVEAATIPVAYLTVVYALGTLGQLQPGERVLIHGGAGGVGLAAIQYARHRGAEIFATAGSPAKQAMLRLLGVEHVLNSRDLSFADAVMQATGGQGVDLVLNSLDGAAMERSIAVLRPFGRFVELGKRDFYRNTAIGLRPLRHNITYFAVDADQLAAQRPDLARSLLAEITGLLADGTLRPLPCRTFAFDAAEAAFRLMQSAGHVGKIVLRPGAAGVRPPPAEAVPFAARADATYVLTGAASGFGAQAAEWLVGAGARHVAILSRRGADDPGVARLRQVCAAHGAQLFIGACDVADQPALAAMLDRIRAALPPIAGVVHAAMVLDDGLLAQLDEPRIATVLHGKLGGALALDRLTRADPIELFVLFSSATTAFGNPGQASYVAANAALEALAEGRRAAGLPALAVAWGPIGDAGALVRAPAVGRTLHALLGAEALTAAEALAALPRLLAAGPAVVGYALLDWNTARAALPGLAGALFADIADTPPAQACEDMQATLAALPRAEASVRVTGLLIAQLAEILKLAPERIDATMPLAELGMDSLMAMELRLIMERRFGLKVPLLSLADGATPQAMATRIVRAMSTSEDAATTLADVVFRHEAAPPPRQPQAAHSA